MFVPATEPPLRTPTAPTGEAKGGCPTDLDSPEREVVPDSWPIDHTPGRPDEEQRGEQGPGKSATIHGREPSASVS